MHIQRFAALPRQRGISTLVVAMVLLIAATFLTFFAARVGIQEQRMAGNDARQKGAFETAEALLDRAKTFLDVNPTAADPDTNPMLWGPCTDATIPCGDGTDPVFDGAWSFAEVRDLPTSDGTGDDGDAALGTLNGKAYFLRRDPPPPGSTEEPVMLVAEGLSDDSTGHAVVRQVLRRVFTVQPGPIPPLTAPAVNLLGSFDLVGNPNHAMTPEELQQITTANCDNFDSGSGQMLSIWTEQSITGGGSWNICHKQLFTTNTEVYEETLQFGQSSSNNTACFLGTTTSGCGCQLGDPQTDDYCNSQDWDDADDQKYEICGIKDNDPDFPTDMFAWLFGASPADVKANADQVLTNCEALSQASTGLIWVTGDCSTPGGDVGSRLDPVVLVVDGELQLNANTQFWGLAVANESPDVRLNGGFTIHGAMVVVDEDPPATSFHASGTYNAIYDPCVFAAIFNNDEFVEYAPVEGSWSDSIR